MASLGIPLGSGKQSIQKRSKAKSELFECVQPVRVKPASREFGNSLRRPRDRTIPYSHHFSFFSPTEKQHKVCTPAASATERRGQCTELGSGGFPAPLPGGAADPEDHVTVAPRCDGRSCDESATSLRRSARPAPHARRVRKVALCGGCAVWRGARVWGERPGARGSRARPVRTAQALALPPARTAAIQVPMDQMRPLTRPRTVAGRAIGARRRAFPSRWQKRAAGVAVASKEMVVCDCGDGDEGLR